MVVNQHASDRLEELTAKYPDTRGDFLRIAFEALHQYPAPCQTLEELEKRTASQMAGLIDRLRVQFNMYEGDSLSLISAAMSEADATR